MTVATNGEEVVNADAAFDVILMYINMPVLNGIEASRRIHALPDRGKQAIPIIALTANILQDEKQKCFAAGMNSFITKPFSPDKLNTEMVTLLCND